MKILIVGGTGFLGTHFCEKLCQENEITVISRHRHKFISDLSKITYIYEDWRILDYDNFFKKNKYDKILLIGWSGHPRSSNEGLLEHFESNTYPSLKLIDKIMTNTHAEIYFLSSHGGLPNIDSGFSKQSISGYAASKLSVEIHLEAYCNNLNRSATAFRLSNPFGPYQDFHGSQGIIPIFIFKALNSKKIPIYDGIETTKDYIYISDAINLMIKSIMSPSKPGFSLVPIISGQKLSILDILSHIELHIPLLDLIPAEIKPKVKSHSKELLHLFSSSSLHKTLNIQIEDLIRWVNENS